jgi:hypothetical protein
MHIVALSILKALRECDRTYRDAGASGLAGFRRALKADETSPEELTATF